jgi:hypothetical protein
MRSPTSFHGGSRWFANQFEPVRKPVRTAVRRWFGRPYQLAAVEAVRARYQRRRSLDPPRAADRHRQDRRVREIARLVVARGKRVLVLAHRTELLEQARASSPTSASTPRIEKARRAPVTRRSSSPRCRR